MTKEEAVNDHWSIYTSIDLCKQYVSVGDGTHVYWNGYMWKQVKI